MYRLPVNFIGLLVHIMDVAHNNVEFPHSMSASSSESSLSEPLLTPATYKSHCSAERMNDCQSLPRDLNTISGGLVNQETLAHPPSPSILTSSSPKPLLFTNTGTERPRLATRYSHRDDVPGPSSRSHFDLSQALTWHYSSAPSRLDTFNNWTLDHIQPRERLVASGLYYAGYADCARCFYCGLGLRGWQIDDDPHHLHALHRSSCPFIRLTCGQEFVDRIQLEARGSSGTAPKPDSVQSGDSLDSPGQHQTSSPSARNGTVEAEVERQMNTSAVQEVLRQGHSRSDVQEAVHYIIGELGLPLSSYLILEVMAGLADAPFAPNTTTTTTTITTTTARSSNTSTGPTSVEMDSAPSTEGHEAVDAIDILETDSAVETTEHSARNMAEQARNSDQQRPNRPLVQQVARPQLSAREMAELTTRENQHLTSLFTCSKCHTKSVDCVNLPCGHVVTCEDCAETLNHCLSCKARILGTAHVYFS